MAVLMICGTSVLEVCVHTRPAEERESRVKLTYWRQMDGVRENEGHRQRQSQRCRDEKREREKSRNWMCVSITIQTFGKIVIKSSFGPTKQSKLVRV
jgi:hypothetical protein